MNDLVDKINKRDLRKRRIRARVVGTPERPRLTVFVSHRNVSAQIIDDTKHATLVYITTVGAKGTGENLTAKAEWVGGEVAKKAKSVKISKVVFDRNGKLFHGRVKALADSARQAGLEF